MKGVHDPMAKRVLLLGLGMQGKAALYDLANCSEVSRIVVVDSRPDLLGSLGRYPSGKVTGRILDAADEASLARLMRETDVVVEALPAAFALPTGRLAADCGVSLVSSMYYLDPGEQDAEQIQSVKSQMQQIDRVAAEKGVVILTEFGLDPGLDLILGARALRELDEVREFRSYGAGIPGPNARANPLQYKFSWSIIGVMKAYRRPARIISGGQIVTFDPDKVFESGNCHILELEEIGVPLECFPNGDSVRYAELFGVQDSIKEMGRYTCRLPGHCAFWNIMVKCGFLDEQPKRIGAACVSPIEFTASLLGSQKQFHYADDEQDIAFIRVEVQGIRRGKETGFIYQLIDTRDLETGFTSMQRTVGFTLSLGARLILEKKLAKTGLLTPLDVPYESVIPSLGKHNIRVVRQESLSHSNAKRNLS
jgi:saccharopine dehydrogenase-like NADP-dependent oxidoreductase